MNILFVHESLTMRRAFPYIMDDPKIKVTVIEDITKAPEQISKEAFDMLLIHLYTVNLFDNLIHDGRYMDIPVAFLTAADLGDIQSILNSTGVNHIISIPLTVERVMELLADMHLSNR